MKTRSNFIKNLAITFIAFMATVLLVCFTIILVIEKTLFSPVYLNSTAVKVNYFKDLSEQVTRSIQDLGQGSGIPEDILAGIITEDKVKKDFEAFSYQALNGSNYEIDKEEFVELINPIVYSYAEGKGQPIEDEVSKANVASFTDQAFQYYQDYVKLPYLQKFGEKIQLTTSKLFLFKVILACCILLMLLFLIYLLHWWKHRLLRYCSHIFAGAGLILMVIPGYILYSKVIQRVAILSKSLYALLTTYVSGFFKLFIIIGIIFLIISILSMFLSEVIRKKNRTMRI